MSSGAQREQPEPLQLFRQPWRFVTEAPNLAALPPEGPPEVAFAGRSNVGKSSLINALTRQSGLARTSNTPGRTQSLNFFAPDPPDGGDAQPAIALVDMPGYGYAQAPKSLVDAWTTLIHDYLRGRRTLKRVFVLVDSRHGLKPADSTIMNELDAAAVGYQIVLTKTDKIKPTAAADTLAAIEQAIRNRAAAFPRVLATSSAKDEGVDALRTEIAAFSSPG